MSRHVCSDAKVRRTKINRSQMPAGLHKLDAVVRAGAESEEVQSSPAARQAHAGLRKAIEVARASVAAKQSLVAELAVAAKAERDDTDALVRATRAYEASVDVLAGGHAAVIHKAGLGARADTPARPSLARVTALRSRPGKYAGEAVLSWPAAAGATHYAIEIAFGPNARKGPFTALPAGTSRRRVVKGPGPGSLVLARVRAVAGDGTRAEWSDALLVTTR
jgi:hypothetical protein